MSYIPRFYFNDNADNGGGVVNDPSKVVPESLITADELKEYGLENKDQLRLILNQHKESKIPAAEKEKQEQLRKASFIQFSAENDLLKVEEVNAYETIKSKADRDLAFEKHLEEWKEDNPEVTDPEDIASQATADFESKYNLNSDNEKQKARGIQKIAKEAAELRSPLSTKYTAAEKAYQEREALKGKLPAFNKAISDLVDKCTPDKLAIAKVKEGESEIPIEVELTKKEREELVSLFRTPKMYQKFESAKDLAEFEASATKKITGFLKEKYFDDVIGKSYTAGKEVGVTKGSTVGAEQPFAIVRSMGIPSSEGRKTADQEVMDNEIEIRKKVSNR